MILVTDPLIVDALRSDMLTTRYSSATSKAWMEGISFELDIDPSKPIKAEVDPIILSGSRTCLLLVHATMLNTHWNVTARQSLFLMLSSAAGFDSTLPSPR